MVLPSQLIVMVGLGIAYSVTGGSALSRIYHLYTSDGDTSFGLSCWILIFMACQLLLSQVGFPYMRADADAALRVTPEYRPPGTWKPSRPLVAAGCTVVWCSRVRMHGLSS